MQNDQQKYVMHNKKMNNQLLYSNFAWYKALLPIIIITLSGIR